MRILIAAIHYPVASGRYIARALKRMGHDVKTVGPNMGNKVWGILVPMRHVWIPDASNPDNDGFVHGVGGYLDYVAWEALGEWKPDLVITADSAFSIRSFTLDDKLDMPHII